MGGMPKRSRVWIGLEVSVSAFGGSNPGRVTPPCFLYGLHPRSRHVCEAGGLMYPVIQVYGKPNSAMMQSTGGGAENERWLAGDCRCHVSAMIAF